jgi:hypothetical protein
VLCCAVLRTAVCSDRIACLRLVTGLSLARWAVGCGKYSIKAYQALLAGCVSFTVWRDACVVAMVRGVRGCIFMHPNADACNNS